MGRIAPKLILFLASGCGVGFSPYLPGTLGTLIAVPVSLAVNRFATSHSTAAIFLLVGLTLIAIGLADRAARILATKDPAMIVIDEIAGFALANFLSTGMRGLILAFILFRFFDIAKVFPATRLEALPGGVGIVLDDIMAGLYTFLILRLFAYAGVA